MKRQCWIGNTILINTCSTVCANASRDHIAQPNSISSNSVIVLDISSSEMRWLTGAQYHLEPFQITSLMCLHEERIPIGLVAYLSNESGRNYRVSVNLRINQ